MFFSVIPQLLVENGLIPHNGYVNGYYERNKHYFTIVAAGNNMVSKYIMTYKHVEYDPFDPNSIYDEKQYNEYTFILKNINTHEVIIFHVNDIRKYLQY